MKIETKRPFEKMMQHVKEEVDDAPEVEPDYSGHIDDGNKVCLPLPFKKWENQEMMELIENSEDELKFDNEIEVKEEGTEQLYQIQVLDEKREKEDDLLKCAKNCDKMKSNRDQTFIINVPESFSLSSKQENDLTLEPETIDMHVTNDSVLQDNPSTPNDKLSFSCEVCGKSFKSKSKLSRHRHIHTGNLPFSCNVCGKSFNQKPNRDRHLHTHTGNLPFSCEVCGKSFSRKENIVAHMYVHTGELPFSCEVCQKSFSSKAYLVKHLPIHTDRGPFSCQECGECFTNRKQSIRHLSNHTNGLPFSCEVCGKSFILKEYLNKHLHIHTGKLPFSCNVCGKSFNRKENRDRHLQIHRQTSFSL